MVLPLTPAAGCPLTRSKLRADPSFPLNRWIRPLPSMDRKKLGVMMAFLSLLSPSSQAMLSQAMPLLASAVITAEYRRSPCQMSPTESTVGLILQICALNGGCWTGSEEQAISVPSPVMAIAPSPTACDVTKSRWKVLRKPDELPLVFAITRGSKTWTSVVPVQFLARKMLRASATTLLTVMPKTVASAVPPISHEPGVPLGSGTEITGELLVPRRSCVVEVISGAGPV